LPEVWRLYFASVRAATFRNWPFTEGCACTPERWEPDDDPLEEHKKHSADCGFLSLQKEPANLTVQEFLKLDKLRMRKALKKEVSQKMTKVEDKAKMQRCGIKNL
ncbi:BIRC5 protein, partial [Rhagologus leucostigma]|nr:BIRC5 protein [Rhagologus leucostigma]